MPTAASAGQLSSSTAPRDHETEVIARAQAGEHDAFEIIMRTHNRMLYRLVRTMVTSDADAEDIVQETYIRAFLKIGDFNRKARLSTWLSRIALNQAIDRRRKSHMTEALDTAENVISMPTSNSTAQSAITNPVSPERAAAQDQIRRYLEIAISQLPADFKSVFVLRGIEEFTVLETAEALSIPPETVKTRYHRAKDRLKSLLDSDVRAALQDTHPFAGARCDRVVRQVLARMAAPPG